MYGREHLLMFAAHEDLSNMHTSGNKFLPVYLISPTSWPVIFYLLQSMSGDMCDHVCACPHMCKILDKKENSPMSTSLSTVQSHILNRNFVSTTATRSEARAIKLGNIHENF